MLFNISPIFLMSEGQIATASTVIGTIIVLSTIVWKLSEKLTKLDSSHTSLSEKMVINNNHSLERIRLLEDQVKDLKYCSLGSNKDRI
jgi:hypothetical protein